MPEGLVVDAAWLIPAFRQISATGIPASPCLMMNAFPASVNFEAFIVFTPSQPREYYAKTPASIEELLGGRSLQGFQIFAGFVGVLEMGSFIDVVRAAVLFMSLV